MVLLVVGPGGGGGCAVCLQLPNDGPVTCRMKLVSTGWGSSRVFPCRLAFDGWPGPGMRSPFSFINQPAVCWKGLDPEVDRRPSRPSLLQAACAPGVSWCMAAIGLRKALRSGFLGGKDMMGGMEEIG